MENTEKMVGQRVVWEKLDNIQVFCGLGKFFFAFKKLKEDNDLHSIFHTLLQPKTNELINFEDDIKQKQYRPYIENSIFKYHVMPSEFYLKKIYYYSRITKERDINMEKERFKHAPLLKDGDFIKDILKKYLETNKVKGDLKSIENNLNMNDLVYLQKLYDIWCLYTNKPMFKKVCDDYIQFTTSKKNLNWGDYLTNTKLEELEILDLLYRTRSFDNGKGYELNVDNYLKIMLILQKQQAGIPVIIMGETGCGKTYLLKYIAEVLFKDKAVFFSFTLYYGVQEKDFIKFIDDIIIIAEKNPDLDIWVFFDEFNTSELQSSVCELMNDRTFSLSTIYEYKCKQSFSINQ